MKQLLIILAACLMCAFVSEPTSVPPSHSVSVQAQREILAFTARWCIDCQKDKLELSGIPNVRIIDVDDYPEIARQYNIRLLPTYIVLLNGKEILRTQNIRDIR